MTIRMRAIAFFLFSLRWRHIFIFYNAVIKHGIYRCYLRVFSFHPKPYFLKDGRRQRKPSLVLVLAHSSSSSESLDLHVLCRMVHYIWTSCSVPHIFEGYC